MSGRTRLTTVETVREKRSWLFTVRDQYGEADEVILVPCEDGQKAGTGGDDEAEDVDVEDVDAKDADAANAGADENESIEAWVNRCTHEAQRLDRGFGAAMRDGQIICPKHGSMFDSCSGYCDNGEAAQTTLVSVEVAVEDGDVYLADGSYTFAHEGGIEESGGGGKDEDDDVPGSTSHIGF